MSDFELVDEEEVEETQDDKEDEVSYDNPDVSSKIEKIKAEFHKQNKEKELFTVATTAHLEMSPEMLVSTGIYGLDAALGVGGIPKGRIVEIFGPEASGKTALSLSVIAEAQKRGWIAAFVDAEHAFMPTFAETLGVSCEDLLFYQPDSAEDAGDVVVSLCKLDVDLIVVDSVSALVPQAELDGTYEKGDKGGLAAHARFMSSFLRKLATVCGETKTVVIFINQLRSKVGVIFGNPEVTTGGNALKFYSSIRIDVRRKEFIKDKDDINTGILTRAKVVKNKLAAPFRETEYVLHYGTGIDKAGVLFTLLSDSGVLNKSGPWYSLDGERMGQGKENTIEMIRQDIDHYYSLVKDLGLIQ